MPCFFPSSDCGRGAHVLRVRSAPRSRLSRLLPFALWQVTSLQAKKQCSRRTTKHGISLPCFLIVRLRVCCSRTSCTLRALFSSFSALAVCFWQVTSLQAKSSVQDVQPSTTSVVLFSFVRLRVCCSRTSCTLRYACSPFAIFDACSAPDYLFVSKTLRSSSSSFSTCAPCFVFGQRLTRDTVPNSNGKVKGSVNGQ